MKKALFLWLFFASLSGYAQTYTDTQLQQHQDSVLRGNSANNVTHPQGRDLLRRLNANKINKVDGASKYDSTQNYTRGSLVFYSGHRWAAADSISIATFPGSSELWQCEDCADGGGGTDPDLTPFSRKDHFAEDFMSNSEDYGGISRFLRADPTSPSGYYIQLRIDSSFVGGGGSSFDLTPYLDGVDDFNAVGLSLRGDGKLTANKQFTLAYFNPTGYSTFTSPWGMLLDFNPSYLAGAPFTINLSGSGVDGWIQTITAGSYDYNNLVVTGDGETLLDTIASLKKGESASWIWSNTANKWFRYLKNRSADSGAGGAYLPLSGGTMTGTILYDNTTSDITSMNYGEFLTRNQAYNQYTQMTPYEWIIAHDTKSFSIDADRIEYSHLTGYRTEMLFEQGASSGLASIVVPHQTDTLVTRTDLRDALAGGGGGGGSDTTRIPYSGTEIGKLISGNLAFNNVANLTYDGPDAVNRIKMDDDGSGGIRLVSTHPSHAYRQSYYSVQPGVFSSAASWEDLSDTTQYRTIYMNIDPYSDQIQVATGYSSALKFHGIVDADDYTANYLPGSHINKAYMLFAADSIASALVSGGGTTTNALSAGTGLEYITGTAFNGSAARTLRLSTGAAAANLGFTPVSNVLSSGNILVGNGSNVATPATMSGDATLDNAGVLTLSNGGLSRSQKVYTQASHGFVAGDVLKKSGGVWAKAQANSAANSEVLGVVESVTTNTFRLVFAGEITLSGLTTETNYFLSSATAGATTTTEPTTSGTVSKPVFYSISTTTAIVQIQRGIVN